MQTKSQSQREMVVMVLVGGCHGGAERDLVLCVRLCVLLGKRRGRYDQVRQVRTEYGRSQESQDHREPIILGYYSDCIGVWMIWTTWHWLSVEYADNGNHTKGVISRILSLSRVLSITYFYFYFYFYYLLYTVLYFIPRLLPTVRRHPLSLAMIVVMKSTTTLDYLLYLTYQIPSIRQPPENRQDHHTSTT